MTNDVERVPAPRASGKRRLAGLAVGLGVLALVAVPAGSIAFAALVSFSGCFIECSGPKPMVGVLYAAIALLLLAVPLVAGLVTARVLTALGWRIALTIAAIIVGLSLGGRIFNGAGQWLFRNA
jgi:hypothetical protein